MDTKTGLSGEYNLVVTRPDGSTSETGWFKNLILDQGLDKIGSTGPVINYCQIGTGTTTPANTQVALTSYSAGVLFTGSPSVVNAGTPTYASSHTITYPFAQGAVIGNMTEIGTGWAINGSNLFSRALITDSNSNPITLTVTSIDQLTVYYKITFTPNTAIVNGSIVLGGITYAYTSSATYIGSIYQDAGLLVGSDFYSQYSSSWCYYAAPASTTTLGLNTTGLANETGYYYGNGLSGGTTLAYTPGSFYRDTVYTLPVGVGNLPGGIGGVRPILGSAGGNGTAKYVFTPAIPKDNTKTFSLTFRTSWARGA